ncbi:MAG: PIG-L family deacetylase [Candidatus Marinimicrobia bacterium]|nr:PIG-L family deacetylase [Candidatus Neomarinimicrobiota bacterium]
MKYYRRTKRGMVITEDLNEIFSTWRVGEKWLFVGPHDDDIILGSGLLLQAALRNNVDVFALVATDGRMGYCNAEQEHTISQVRKKETLDSFRILGLPEENIFFANIPDCDTNSYIGRRKAKNDDPEIKGYTGLQNAFTYFLRKVTPTRVFLPTGADLHPDHKIIYQEMLISLFHAGGNIWPELGPALKNVPWAYEFSVYCDFATPPTIKVLADDLIFQKKLEGVLAYKSQEQIASLVENLKNGGPVEFFKSVDMAFYHPENHTAEF